MAQAVQLMLAVFMAFAVFGVGLYCVSRLLHTEGWLRRAYAVCVAALLLSMGAMMALSEGVSLLGVPPVPVAKLGALLLAPAALLAIWLERGSGRWTLVPLLAFSGFVISGAPFA